MKLTILIVLLATFNAVSMGVAQTVDLKLKNSSLENAFSSIRKQTGYRFIYKESALSKASKVSVDLKNESLESTLQILLKDQPLEYQLHDGTVVIKPNYEAGATVEASIKAVQQREIGGKVTDLEGNPLTGVTVTVKGASTATSTNENGEYELSIPTGSKILVFSTIGYISIEKEIGIRSQLNVVLEPEIDDLEEVVVVGYGTQKKENLTGAVSSVNFQDALGDRPINTIGTVLQGAAPGLQVTQTTGEPGGGFSMNVRGTTSINGGSPLILVDNVPFDGGLNLLNPADIESISVLKDAASASIYGARSAYGVILITTKKGKKNDPVSINYHNNLTIQTAPFLPVKANPIETVEAYKNTGEKTYYSGQDIETWLDYLQRYQENPAEYPFGFVIDNGTRYQLKETDDMGDMLDNMGTQMNHNLSVRGGGQHSSYGLSFGSTQEDGIIVTDKDKFNRYNIRGFSSTDVKPWLNVSIDMLYNNSLRTMPNGSMWFQAATSPSYTPVDTIHVNGVSLPSGTGGNFTRLGAINSTKNSNFRTTGRLLVTPVSKMRIIGEYTFDKINGLVDNYAKRIRYANAAKFGEEFNRSSSEYIKYNETTDYKALNVFGDYIESIQNHNIKLLLGFNQESRYYERQYSSISQMINDDLPSISQGIGEPITNDSYDEYGILGFFGRVNYDFDGRYLLEINGRYDGSSKFPENSRWGFFPSISLGWRVIDENFMRFSKEYLSELKLRASYGTVGNQAINTYAFVPGMSSFRSNWLDNNTQPITLNAPSLVSENFTWETVVSKNIGIDFGILKNKLTGTVDFYTRETKDMLAAGEELPAVLGAAAPLKNVADLKTRGFEVELKWQDKIGEVKYGLGGNLYNSEAEITKFNNEGGLISQYYVGQKIGEIWGYQFDRFYTVDDFVDGTLSSEYTNGKLKEGIPVIEGVNPNPGDVLFKDLNDDKLINAGNSTLGNPGDRSVIGNSSLRYQLGLNGNVEYKGFRVSFNLQGVFKRDRYLNNDLTNAYNYEFGTIYKHQLNYWRPDVLDPDYPRLYISGFRSTNHTSNYRNSTFALLDGSYLRLQNITIGYSIQSEFLKNLGIYGTRVFMSSENLYTWSKLPKGIDPATDAKSNGLGYPYMRSFSFGININL